VKPQIQTAQQLNLKVYMPFLDQAYKCFLVFTPNHKILATKKNGFGEKYAKPILYFYHRRNLLPLADDSP
jgi:hypothetical protein